MVWWGQGELRTGRFALRFGTASGLGLCVAAEGVWDQRSTALPDLFSYPHAQRIKDSASTMSD